MNTITIFHRVLEPIPRSLPPEKTQQIAQAEADERFQQRVEDLARKANEGELTADERREFQAYIDAGDVVATMRAVARKLLNSLAG